MDPLFDIRREGIAIGIVAIAATILILFSAAFAGHIATWLRPKWAHPSLAWNGFAIFAAFVGYHAASNYVTQSIQHQKWFPSADEAIANTWSIVAARWFVVPVFFAMIAFGQNHFFGSIRVPTRRRIAGWVALGALAWFPIHLLVTAVHVAANAITIELGGSMTPHPLAKLNLEEYGAGPILFATSICFFTPLFEEFFFRGIMLPWVMRANYRPWILVGWSFLFACTAVKSITEPQFAALGYSLLFFAIGAVAIALCHRIPVTHPRRTIIGILSTSLVFATVHTSVWPSPIPLFVLALGLGYLRARTGSIVPGVVVHGLLNGVATILVYRGSAG